MILEDTERSTLEKPSLSTSKGEGNNDVQTEKYLISHSSLVNNDREIGINLRESILNILVY